MVHPAVFIGIDFHIALTAGKAKPGRTVFCLVYVFAASDRKQPCVEFYIIGIAAIKGSQTFVISEGQRFPMFATAQINGGSLSPVFHTDLLGELTQRLVTIFAPVVYNDVVNAFDYAHFPVVRAETVIDAFYNQRKMLPRGCGKRKHRLVITVHALYHKEILYKALDTVHFQVVDPFAGAFLLGTVLLCQPISLPHEVRVIIDIKSYMPGQCEGQGQHIIPLYLLDLCR